MLEIRLEWQSPVELMLQSHSSIVSNMTIHGFIILQCGS